MLRYIAVRRLERCIAALLLAPFGAAAFAQTAPILQWQTPAPNGQAIAVAPDASVAVVDDQGVLRSFAPDGSVKWSLALGSPLVGSLVPTGDGGFVAATQDSRLVSISPAGQKRWDVTLSDLATGRPTVGADGSVYVAAGTKLLAYSSAGAPLWTFDDNNALTGTPAASAAGVAVGAMEGGVYFVDPTGKQIYHYAYLDTVPDTLTVTSAGTVSYLSAENEVVGLDAKGNKAWSVTPADPMAKYSLNRAVARDGILYIVLGNTVQAVTPDGKVGWTFDAGAGISTPLAFTSDNNLVVGTSDNRILVVSLQGQKVSEADLSNPAAGVGAAPGGRYYALLGQGGAGSPTGGGTGTALLAAFSPDTTPPIWKPVGLQGTTILAMSLNTDMPNVVYASSDKAVSTSSDGGATWTTTAVSVPSGDTGIAYLAAAKDGSAYATSQSFLFYSDPGGAAFNIVDRADDAGAVAVDPKDPAHVVYANAITPEMYTITQKGMTGISSPTPVIFTGLLMTSDGTLYATADDGLYKQPSDGDWAKVADGRTVCLAATPDGKTVYAGGDGRILKSTDSGATFQEMKSDQLVGTVYRLAVSPANGGELMAGTVFTATMLSTAGIRGINMLHSTDGGANWTVLDKGLKSVDPHGLVAGSGYFLAGTGDGVYRLDLTGGGGGPGPTPGVKGDLNGDGKVNVADATVALQIAVGLIQPTPAQLQAGDVAPASTPDGQITVADATRILQAAVGLIQL